MRTPALQTSFRISRLTTAEAFDAVPALADILVDCVEGGALVSFMAGLTHAEARAFWTRQVGAGDGRVILAAEDEFGICGVVQVVPAWPQNQQHRADVVKLLVHSRARRRGIAEALMEAAELAAREHGWTLLMLNTVTGGPAERMYTRMGWTPVGSIPNYSLRPNGEPAATTIFYKAPC